MRKCEKRTLKIISKPINLMIEKKFVVQKLCGKIVQIKASQQNKKGYWIRKEIVKAKKSESI